MPRLTRFYLKLSFIWLVLALLLSVLQVWPRLQQEPLVVAAAPLKFHFLMMGWVLQLIFGVIYWMFPKATRGRPRGHTGRNWAAFLPHKLGFILALC